MDALDAVNHDINKLYDTLRERVVRFVFLKKSGEFRIASGTLNPSLIPFESHPKGKRKSSKKVLCFFDTDKQAWRCLLRERLMGFVEQ